MKADKREYLRTGRKFQKRKEDFICGNCGKKVRGNGYTNHCPQCLWSRHVDINPGDRAASCHGMMKPARIESSGKGFAIIHRCEKCGYEKKNKVHKEDDLTGYFSS